jgi:hypothetical protein
MQLRSKRRDQHHEKDRPLTPHFIVSVARGPDVANVRSLTDLCGLREKMDTYNAQKAAAMQTLPAVRTHPALLRLRTKVCGLRGSAPIREVCHSKAAAAMGTRLPTIVVIVSGKKQRKLLQSESNGHFISQVGDSMLF